MSLKKSIGPGALVAAAFIGPGTITVCTLAGINYDYDLTWVLLFATLATIVLQNLAAKLGAATGAGLGEALRSQLKNPLTRTLGLILVFIAIIAGNAAYEMGNITGTMLSLDNTLIGNSGLAPLVIGLIVGLILMKGDIKLIQNVMSLLVVIMSLVFVTSAVLVGSLSEFLAGLVPSIPTGGGMTALALIGTTIVPYNLFLHASAISSSKETIRDLPNIRKGTILTIGLGGLVSICVLVTAASGDQGLVESIIQLAANLEPLMGDYALPFLSMGIFAAGISSSLTAPLAAALTAKGLFGWDRDWRYHSVWVIILVLGVVFSTIGLKPIFAIQIAQVANGLLLPIIVIFLILMCNKEQLMANHKNTALENILSGIVLIIALIVSIRSFNSVFHFLQ